MTKGRTDQGETTESHIAAQAERFRGELHRLRVEARLSQGELAHALGLKSASIVSQMERGVQPPTFDTLLRLRALFGVSLESLVEAAAPHHTNQTTIHTLFSASGGSVMFLGCEHLETLVEWLKSRASVSESP